ncbi:PREDICTED: zinc finger BED domain-containing protein RICESLEEPER 1-like isoform X2 [Lupinus angustifolius]|uniref:zinc finger BED domain-containing protein RICESLEEPER 1-like isoform X2 n=1 Tax=Lupinus angustifolius TaxID=3871 RepID=UPI00092E3986|nr:PREDICTED: zinc finger BED domain-containing protein RICESLEEPER 1-like isoform X2 [Lupinus angustifolius]
MLESAINYRRVFTSFSLHDTNYIWCPLEDEWSRAEIICDFLRPFNNITKLISGSSYPTSNLYLGETWTIECLLNSILTNEDLVVQQMARNMKAKFEKYWSDYTMVLAFGDILDPSKKLDFVQYLYEEVDPFYVEKVKHIQMNLYRLYNEYVNKDDQSNESLSQVHASSSLGGGSAKKFQVPLYQARFEQHKNTKRTTS